jgi:hypothetical protein
MGVVPTAKKLRLSLPPVLISLSRELHSASVCYCLSLSLTESVLLPISIHTLLSLLSSFSRDPSILCLLLIHNSYN